MDLLSNRSRESIFTIESGISSLLKEQVTARSKTSENEALRNQIMRLERDAQMPISTSVAHIGETLAQCLTANLEKTLLPAVEITITEGMSNLDVTRSMQQDTSCHSWISDADKVMRKQYPSPVPPEELRQNKLQDHSSGNTFPHLSDMCTSILT